MGLSLFSSFFLVSATFMHVELTDSYSFHNAQRFLLCVNADSYQSGSGVPTDNDPNNTTVGFMLQFLYIYVCPAELFYLLVGSFLTHFKFYVTGFCWWIRSFCHG